jgi:hypothetical protein
VGARSFNDLRTALALAVTQGAALGMVAGCAGKSERQDGGGGERSGTTGGQSTGGSTTRGGSTNTGGDGGAQSGSTAGTTSVGGASSVAGSGATGGIEAPGGSAGSNGSNAGSGGTPALEPYALDDLGCLGPTLDGGYDGQCCVSALCYTPAEGACLAASERPPIPLPLGSGTCSCPVGEGSNLTVRGPYAPNPGGSPSQDGTCCYLVGSIGCEGRPFVVAGAAIVAPLARRGDWCAALP